MRVLKKFPMRDGLNSGCDCIRLIEAHINIGETAHFEGVVHGIEGTYPRYQLDDSTFRMIYYFGRYEAFCQDLGGGYDILYRKQ